MRKLFLLSTFLFLLTISCQLLAINHPAYSQSTVGVAAIVGSLTLNISGYASPNASVIITSNNTTLASTTADSQGAFSFSLNVQNNFSAFCIIATDTGGLKTSSCYTIPPLTQSSSIPNLLLPPSISSQTTQIYAGQNITIFGYTVPNALVTIQINASETVTVTADSNGYYSYTYQKAGVGSYQFTSTASTGTLTSAPSNKSLTVNSLATPQSIEKSEDTEIPNGNTTLNQTVKNALNPIQKISNNPFLWLPIIGIILFLIIAILLFLFRKKPWLQNMIMKIKSRFQKLSSLILDK